MKKLARFEGILLPPLLLTLVACGSGGGGGGAPAGGGGGGGGGTGPALMPTFESIQEQVFDQLCISCHIGASAPLGLRLDDVNSYALLVGVASAQQPALQRVDPGDPDDSYLIRKLDGTATTGGRMPLGLPALPAADIAVIRQWITDGAQPAGGQAPLDPVRVTSFQPLPGATGPTLPMSVTAIFDRELAATTVDQTTFLVERSGGDGTFGDGNEVAINPVSVDVPAANPMTAVFDMSTTTSVNDTYRVTLVGTGPATIQDLDGNSLDGEFSGSFPSGNGTAGGNFAADFEVAGVEPTLSSIQDNVFTPICSACHTGPQGSPLPGGMDLTSVAMSFAALVGVPSVQNATIDLVEPGDPDDSYLIHKLEGTAAAPNNTRMPLFGTPLDQATIDAIRQWITDGAMM
ncbi:MAG TPA: Ig-like domain-containing protein [Gammaproteobacteria bacterium]|nr:Ig-like domain-containing protein [Gammaproteobacteria bacterium]